MGKQPTGALLPTFEEPDTERANPLHLRVYRRLRSAILTGHLAPGDRLPSSRTLARDLAVSRNTVETAFSQLDVEGYLERRVGAGSFVAAVLPQRPEPRRRGSAQPRPEAASAPPSLSERGRAMTRGVDCADCATGRLFAPCTPGLDAFPVRTWQKLLGRHARRLGAGMLGNPEPDGYRPLREAIASYLGTARGVGCDWRRVVVLTSTQQALDLASRLLVDPGDEVWMEDPGYLGARSALANAGATLVPVPVDDEGVDVEEGVRRAPNARMAYVTPSHQYPLGATLSLSRRLRLLEWAAQSNAWIFEDDYDSEFRYTGRPFAAVQGLDRSGRVLYSGTFNKSVFPGLRLAYLVLPESLVEPFAAARSTMHGPAGTLAQAVMADFMGDGHFGAHIRAMRNVYQERRHTLLDAAEAELQGRIRLGNSDTGLHVTGYLPPGPDDAAVSAAASKRGLDVPALSRYYLGEPGASGLILNYAAVPAPDIRRGITSLRAVLDELQTPAWS